MSDTSGTSPTIWKPIFSHNFTAALLLFTTSCIALHRKPKKTAGLFEGQFRHLLADAFSFCVRRNHIRSICDVRPQPRLICLDPKCPGDFTIETGDEACFSGENQWTR